MNVHLLRRSDGDLAIYSRAQLYDIAFSFRDYRREVDVMLNWYKRATGAMPRSILELAAGPARHALEFARRGMSATALDLSPAMVRYARGLARKQRRKLRVVRGDMRAFKLGRRFDLALLMMASDQHLLTQRDLVRHLRCVGRHLTPGGVFIVESAYPEKPGEKARVQTHWKQKRGGLTVGFSWGGPGDPRDARRKVRSVTITVTLGSGKKIRRFVGTTRQREWTLPDFRKALRKAASFELVNTYGVFEPDAPLDEKAWRMIRVLRRA